MSTRDSDTLRQAEQHLREHRFAEAIACFDEHLVAHPEDTRALLQLGICHLLTRSERKFLEIHEQACRRVQQAPSLGGEVSRLWATYRSLVSKLGVAAVAAGAAAGCDPSPAQAPDVQPETATATAVSEPAAESTAQQSAAGGAAPNATAPASDATAMPTSTAAAPPTAASTATAPNAASPPAVTTTPAHRYSGGVYRPPTKPAHRYSGGVRY